MAKSHYQLSRWCGDGRGQDFHFLGQGDSPLIDRFSKEPGKAVLSICTTLAFTDLLGVIREQACECQIEAAALRREWMPCTVLQTALLQFDIIDSKVRNLGFSRVKATAYLTAEEALSKSNFQIYVLRLCLLVFQLSEHFSGLGQRQHIG